LTLKSPSIETILNCITKNVSSWKTMSIIAVICKSILSGSFCFGGFIVVF